MMSVGLLSVHSLIVLTLGLGPVAGFAKKPGRCERQAYTQLAAHVSQGCRATIQRLALDHVIETWPEIEVYLGQVSSCRGEEKFLVELRVPEGECQFLRIRPTE